MRDERVHLNYVLECIRRIEKHRRSGRRRFLESDTIHRVSDFVARGGTLVVITRARDAHQPEGAMPWPLTNDDMAVFDEAGLTCLDFEDFVDEEEPPVRRFRATYVRR